MGSQTGTQDQVRSQGARKVTRRKGSGIRSLSIAQSGIYTGGQFASFMSALMSDVIEGEISPGVCNAACKAGGNLLKIVEMQLQYGTPNGENRKELQLATPVKQLASE